MSWDLNKDQNLFSDMKPHIKRFFYCFVNPFGVNKFSPRKNILGIRDLPHAYVNLFVEFCRASPYHSGHVFSILIPLLILLAVL